MPRDQLADARRAAMMPDMERLTLEAARHLALRSAVGIVVSGRVDKVGASYNVILEATNVVDGGSLGSVARAATETNILEMTRGLGERLRAVLVGRAAARSEPVSGAKTRSLAAYRQFAAAMADSMASSQAVPFLREAVAVDSEFAAAWAELGFVLNQLGRFDSSRAAYRQAQRWERRLTSRERIMLEARIARDLHLDSETAVGWWDRLIGEEPTLGIAHGWRALALRDIGRYDEASTSCKRAIELSPLGARPSEIDTCGETMAAVGQMAQPREWSKTAQGGFKWDLEVVIATGENNWARLDSLARAGLSTRGSTGDWRPYNLLAAAQAARGQVADARETLRRNKATFFYPGAVWFLELLLGAASGGTPDRYSVPPGYPDSVASGLGPVFEHANELLFSMWAAWRGDTASAERQYRAHVAHYKDLFGKLNVEVAMSRAWLDACQGRWNRVPELLAADAWIGINGPANGWWGQLTLRRWLVAEAYEHMGRLDSAAAFFKTMTTATRSNAIQGADSRGLVHSFALRRVALLEEQVGQADSARVHWEQFLHTFTRPDPEFQPWVAEAQRKLGRKRS